MTPRLVNMDQIAMSLKRKRTDTKNDLKALMSSGPFQSKLVMDEDVLASEILYYAKTLEPLQRGNAAPSEFTQEGLLAAGLAECYISNAKQMIQTEQTYDAEYRVFYHACDQALLMYKINSIIAQAISGDPENELPPIFRLMATPFEKMRSTDDLISTLSVYNSSDHDTAFNGTAICANACICPDLHESNDTFIEANPLSELSNPDGYTVMEIEDPLKLLLEVLYGDDLSDQIATSLLLAFNEAHGNTEGRRHRYSSSHVFQIFCKDDIVNNLCYEAVPYGFPAKYTKSPLDQTWLADDTPYDTSDFHTGNSIDMAASNKLIVAQRPVTRRQTEEIEKVLDRTSWPVGTRNHQRFDIPSIHATARERLLPHGSAVATRSAYHDTLPIQAGHGTYWERLHSDKPTVTSQARIYVHPQWFGGTTFETQSPSYWSGGTQIRTGADSHRPKTPEVRLFQYTINPLYDRHTFRQAIRDIIGAQLTRQHVPSIRARLGLPRVTHER